MTLRHKLLLFLALSWLISGCMPAPSAPVPIIQATTLPAATTAPTNDVHILFAHTAHLKRVGWRDFYAVGWGTVLHRGDLLQAGAQEDVKIVCDTLTLTHLSAGTTKSVTDLCPPQPEVVTILKSGEYSINKSRGGLMSDLPYIITPRQSLVSTTTPHVRWNPVPNATVYTVRIIGHDWHTTTTDTALLAPPLQRGQVYQVVVEATNGDWVRSSQEENLPRTGFLLIESDDAQRIEGLQMRVQALELDSAEFNYTLAILYQTEQLYSEAITHLHNTIDNTQQSGRVHLLLGDLYRRISLESDAITAYNQALSLGADDWEAVAVANTQIAAHHNSFWRREEAFSATENALTAYQTIGDTVAERIQRGGMARIAADYADELAQQDQPTRAAEWYQRAYDLYGQLGDIQQAAFIEQKLAP